MATTYIKTGAIVKTNATGAVAIAASASVVRASRLTSVTLHFDAAPTTSENFTITLNANAGAAYDAVIYSLDLSSGSTTDLLYHPDGDLFLEPGDSVDVAYTNTDTGTYGLQITLEEI